MAVTTARAVLAAGLVGLDMQDPTTLAYKGFGQSLDADKLEITPNYEEKTSESRSHLDYGQARASVILPKPTEITVELSASSVEAMAMQFQGMVQDLTQSGGTQADTTFVIAERDVWLPLGKRNIADGLTLKEDDGIVTYTEGTHYSINYLRGEIMVHSVSGAPAKGVDCKVAYAYGAVDGKKILGGRVTQVRCRLRFDGKNMVDGSPIEVDVHECVLGSSNGFDFLGSDFSSITLSGKIVTPTGKTEGYEIRYPGVSAV